MSRMQSSRRPRRAAGWLSAFSLVQGEAGRLPALTAQQFETQQLSSERCLLPGTSQHAGCPRRDGNRHLGATAKLCWDSIASIFMQLTSKLPCLALRPAG